MQTIGVRELLHNFSKHMKIVKAGHSLTILERNVAIADIVPHNKNVSHPGWRRDIKRRKIKGENFSESVIKLRDNE
ncbi:MAG: hypothetical protein JW841_16245 [Deltaproteobacteria bacterium]|nr:hypothetical protein [Deltaproteobacteria bacterium]